MVRAEGSEEDDEEVENIFSSSPSLTKPSKQPTNPPRQHNLVRLTYPSHRRLFDAISLHCKMDDDMIVVNIGDSYICQEM
ncbi:hypothetical protein X798_02101 [Onchocerca flexuosa]|uniref:Ovule protein n=2 Tax=Onchocerca flexuosa TaxID=387005 RepID=A0A183HD05_9BILA|nr:hypothetical protein X798_02101 [Onchocerca flexuosa]VDO42911.1 unnamed protein product [Onchocerca flexuosa]